ncbi:MAG: hypothetical protein J6C56_01760 [Alistipes sp.]|nr:hypothetical protein [Alistipes sp.]
MKKTIITTTAGEREVEILKEVCLHYGLAKCLHNDVEEYYLVDFTGHNIVGKLNAKENIEQFLDEVEKYKL